ncbi:ribosome small subunit-dependent GTPase A [Candidatus Poribacteria bacterium]|nr:ribosome small subunit-dependent GTPase A [Candidatus Poribacteria bacterium]
MNCYPLPELGWDEAWQRLFEAQADAGWRPARVATRHKDQYIVLSGEGEHTARIKGHLRYRAEEWTELPVVGDWVMMGRRPHEPVWRIHGILERRVQLSRKAAGSRFGEQVLAANVDSVGVVMGLDEDFNPRRLERYLVAVRESGARPVVILNKADLLRAKEIRASCEALEQVANGSTVMVTSASKGSGLAELRSLLAGGQTVVFVGSSGAGKSSLVNCLLGEERQATGEVRESDGEGRHTTSRREMIVLPGGGIVIDSPGIRELQIWSSEESVEAAFAEIEAAALQCRFSDCRHETEPGCAVRAAIEAGLLDEERLQNYLEMRAERERVTTRRQRMGEATRRAFKPQRKRG